MSKQNPWRRGPEAERNQPIEDITKNVFERDRERTIARNAAAAANAVDTKRIKEDAQRHFDATHRTTMTGALMDPALAAASDRYHADRRARKNQATESHGVTTLRTIIAIIEHWENSADNAKNFYRSEFNYVSLVNCFITRVFGRHHPLTVEEVADAYAECLTGNHLELPYRVDGSGGIIRKRGERRPLPPTLFPKFIWPQEEAAARDAEIREALAVMLGTSVRRKAEDAANRRVPLAEQQKQVRADYKPDALPRDLIGSGVL